MEERLNALLRLAISLKATDIHFTRTRLGTKVEMRVNDRIRLVKSDPKDDKMIRYLQYLANLDVGNLIRPQTGQFEYLVDDVIVSLRFALIHNQHLDNAVLRILNSDLCIGTLLHNVTGKKIFTIEDPIEMQSENFIQLNINETIGFGYDEAIKQVLRHDPDIIMIGEIRDEITAHMAIRAAHTGHTVVTSLHAASCPLAIERLLELKVEKGQLYNVLIGVSNQRLFSQMASDRKVVIYETMDRDEIIYYFRYGKVSSDFYALDERIEDAKRKGVIQTGEFSHEFTVA